MSTTSQKYSEHSLKKTNELKYKIEPPKNSSAPKVQNNFTCANNEYNENFDNKSEGQIAAKTKSSLTKEMAVKKVKIYKYQNLY
jgi:flagellar basal body L-ring protein FlgH